jgi:alpha-galactosidase
VLGTIGFGGWEMQGPHLSVANAQLAVSGEKGKYPEFKGNVLTVETRDFWRTVEQSPRNQGYHYNRNAETYMLVGEALGRGMVELMEQKK